MFAAVRGTGASLAAIGMTISHAGATSKSILYDRDSPALQYYNNYYSYRVQI